MSLKEDFNETKKELKELEEQSFAMEMIKFSNSQLKSANKRQFIIIIILLIGLFASVGYTIYILNDIGTIKTDITQDSNGGTNNYIGNDGDINYGKAKD